MNDEEFDPIEITNDEDGPRRVFILELNHNRGSVKSFEAHTSDGRELKPQQITYRLLRFESEVPVQAGETVKIRYDKAGEPLTLVREPRWFENPDDVSTNPDDLHTASDKEIFAARSSAARDLGDEDGVFFAEYDRETYTQEEPTPTCWTRLDADPPTPLPEDQIAARKAAIVSVGEKLEERVEKRGVREELPGWSDLGGEMRSGMLLIDELHHQLFRRRPHFFKNAFDVSAIGLAYARFANGDLKVERKIRGATYQNGQPNGTAYLQFPEFVSLMAQSGFHSDLWRSLLPYAVAGIPLYCNAYFHNRDRTFKSYRMRDYDTARDPLDDAGVRGTVERFQGFGEKEFHEHWTNVLRVLAPKSFSAAITMHHDLDFYVGDQP